MPEPGPEQPDRTVALAVVGLLVMLAAALAAGLLAFRWSAAPDAAAPRTYFPLPQRPAPEFALVDPSGRTVTAAALHGRVGLVFFGYTACPDVCPTTLVKVAAALAALGPAAEGVAPVFISLDPERDSAERLGRYAAAFHPHILALTGDTAAVNAAAEQYGAFHRRVEAGAGGYLIDHSALLFLQDRAGRVRGALGHDATAQDLERVLRDHL